MKEHHVVVKTLDEHKKENRRRISLFFRYFIPFVLTITLIALFDRKILPDSFGFFNLLIILGIFIVLNRLMTYLIRTIYRK